MATRGACLVNINRVHYLALVKKTDPISSLGETTLSLKFLNHCHAVHVYSRMCRYPVVIIVGSW